MSHSDVAEQLLPLWAAAKPSSIPEDSPEDEVRQGAPRLEGAARCRVRAAALALACLVVAACLLAATVPHSRGRAQRSGAVTSGLAGAWSELRYAEDIGGIQPGLQSDSTGSGSDGSSGELSDEKAKEILNAMKQSSQAGAGSGGTSASDAGVAASSAGGSAVGQTEWSSAEEAEAASQWALAQAGETSGAASGAQETPAVTDEQMSTVAITTTSLPPTTLSETSTTLASTETTVTITLVKRVTTTNPERCGLMEPGIDYPGNDLRAVGNKSSADLCCQECAEDLDCVAWVWGKKRGASFSDMCFLKGGHPRGQITRVGNPDVVSGQPTQTGRSIATLNRSVGQSLFCFALMLPNSYEGSLLRHQYNEEAGIFGCDEYSVYSNVTMEVAPGCSTLPVFIDLHSEMGGEFGTALNTGVFLAIWSSLVGAGRYLLHDWTVKVDPDTVFFAPRLRLLVKDHKEVDGGVYLNNCKYGLHGPLEVFSRNAVTAWDGAQSKCKDHFWKVCSGDCNWGEDMFIDQCLNFTGVQRDNEYKQLTEDHCDPPDGWTECKDTDIVAFHPFKTVAKQEACTKNALSSQ